MAHGAVPSPDSGRNKTATAINSSMPGLYRERTKGAPKCRSSSMGAELGEYPTMVVQPSFQPGFNYVSPLRSLYSTAPPCVYVVGSKGDTIAPAANASTAFPGHHPTASANLVKQMRQRYGQKSGEAERTSRTPWMIPALALINLIAFILVMSHNNCDRKGADGNENDDCIFIFLRRFPFQSLTENPLLGPSAMSLLDFGALESDLVSRAGQGWRLITTLSMHAGLFHLAGNLAGLFYVGLQLEREFGFWKVLLIHYLAGFSGALVSALFVHGRVSVGASGATLGLVGARLAEVLMNWDTSSLHHRNGSIVSTSLFLLISIVYGLLPLMDNFMHLGGFIAGSLLGNVLLIRPRADWVKLQQQQYFPAVIYDVDDLPVRSKYSHCQKVVWVVSLNILVAGFVAALFAHYTGVDARRGCNWCHYMTCLRTDLWKCYGDRNIVCDSPIQPGHMQIDCLGHHLRKPKTIIRNGTVQEIFTRCIKSCI